MKKFYTTLLLALISLVAPMASQAYEVTLNIDDPAAVSITLSYWDTGFANQTRNEITPQAATKITYDDTMSYVNIKVSQKEGYKITSFTDANGQSVYGYSGEYQFTVYASNDGGSYNITTANLSIARTATAYVKVVGSASTIRASRGGESITLSDSAETAVKFIPGVENTFSFQNSQWRAFYRVSVDGVEKVMDSYTIDIEVTDGTKIEIEPNYPEIPVPLTINVPTGMESFVKSVNSNWTEIEGWVVNKAFNVTAGSSIQIELDVEAYQLDSLKINGATQEPTSNISFTLGTEATTVDIYGHAYAQLNYIVKIDDPSRVAVYEGYSSTPISGLVAGENALSISEKTGQIQIKATYGNDITAVKDKDGNVITSEYKTYTVTEGSYFDVASQARVYDGKFVVYVNDLSNVKLSWDGETSSAYWQTEEDRDTKNFITENYTVIDFASASNVQYDVRLQSNFAFIAYINGELQENNYSNTYFYWYGVPANGNVIKVYTNDVAPTEHKIKFTEVAKGAKVTMDKIVPVTDFTTDITALTGTLFEIEAPEGKNVSVTVDGVELTKGENGKYTFSASADHQVAISASSGVSTIDAESATVDGPVYNLQGIKVLNNSANLNELPAGMYIVNGKKQIVR